MTNNDQSLGYVSPHKLVVSHIVHLVRRLYMNEFLEAWLERPLVTSSLFSSFLSSPQRPLEEV